MILVVMLRAFYKLFYLLFCDSIDQWEKTVQKRVYSQFERDKLPLKMPELKIGNSIIKRKSSVKFLGVMLDETI